MENQRTTFKEAFIPDLMNGAYACKTPLYEAGKEIWQEIFCFYMKTGSLACEEATWYLLKYSILLSKNGEIIRAGWHSHYPRVNESGI